MVAPTARTYLLAAVLGLGLGTPTLTWAADGGPEEDGGTSSLPDASVGGGGADRDNPEGDDNTGRVVTNCRSSNDCSPRFTCSGGKCQYTGIREATRVGCLLGPEGALVLAGLGLVSVWRRRKR